MEKMLKKSADILIRGGAVLLCAALLLFAWDLVSEKRAADWQKEVCLRIDEALPAVSTGLWDECLPGNMPVLPIDDTDFCAMIQAPGSTERIPVAAAWETGESLIDKAGGRSRTPRRFSGSLYDRDLIIGGSDSERQFGFLKELYMGDPVCIIDMKGHIYNYTVCSFTRTDNADAQTLQSVGTPLLLFVRLDAGGEYLLVGCKASN